MKIFFWNWNCGNYQFWIGSGTGTELPNWAFGTELELWNYQARRGTRTGTGTFNFFETFGTL